MSSLALVLHVGLQHLVQRCCYILQFYTIKFFLWLKHIHMKLYIIYFMRCFKVNMVENPITSYLLTGSHSDNIVIYDI